MKFQFKIQGYQTEAVEDTVNVFRGQPKRDPKHYRRDIGKIAKGSIFSEEEEAGYRNADVELDKKRLLDNIRDIQILNQIVPSTSLSDGHGVVNLDIEMETGTGKTYVYIKTMFELNKQYGWSKFIIVVPSIAIREGVAKSFRMLEDHFMEHYGKKARWFVYNSSNLNQLDQFSQDSGISVMIINTQAFAASLKEGGRSKESRIIYSKRDEFGSRRPIDVIAANRPSHRRWRAPQPRERSQSSSPSLCSTIPPRIKPSMIPYMRSMLSTHTARDLSSALRLSVLK